LFVNFIFFSPFSQICKQIIAQRFLKVNSKEVTFCSGIVYTKNISFELGGVDITTGDAIRMRILELCHINNITINKLATISGVTQSTVNNIISKRNNSTTVATIKKLCDGLGITISEFFDTEYFNTLEQELK